MSRALKAVSVFICSILLEVGWVLSVRFVGTGEVWKIVVWAMGMQTIAYAGLLPVVGDRRLAVAGVIGAGVGAAIGMTVGLS